MFLLFFVWFKGWLFTVLSGPDGLPDGIGIVGEDEHIVLDGEELPIGAGAPEIVGVMNTTPIQLSASMVTSISGSWKL